MSEQPVADLHRMEGDGLAAVASLWRKTGRELRARFGGSSMDPALPAGAEVVLRCGEGGGVGDVIAFLSGGRLVVHRVVARASDGRWILTRGDARVMPDAPIRDPEAVVGRVVGLWRDGALEPMPAAPDSLRRRLVLGLARGVLTASPAGGAAVLRAAHYGARIARSAALAVRRRATR